MYINLYRRFLSLKGDLHSSCYAVESVALNVVLLEAVCLMESCVSEKLAVHVLFATVGSNAVLQSERGFETLFFSPQDFSVSVCFLLIPFLLTILNT